MKITGPRGVVGRGPGGRIAGMADPPISQRKEAELRRRMAALGIAEEDLRERFVRGSGPGGQKVNKTSSCVHLLHVPTGTEVKCQQARSQVANRFFARRELCERIAERVEGERTRRQQERERIRRQKRRRSRRAQERMLEAKHRQAERKQARKSVGLTGD